VVVQGEQTGAEALDDFASITALDAEKLADAGIENVEDAAAYVPNLSLTQTETGTNIFIRGVGSGVNQGFDQSVGLFSDGVPLPRANMARAPFLDLASLQVKRGPQYVLDGNFAIAGSVHMLSNLSLDAFKAGIDINYTPSQNDRTLLLTVGGPINESLAANLILQRKKSEGYTENLFKDRYEGQNDNQMARIVLGWHSENASLKLKAEIGDFKTLGRAAEIIIDNKTPDASVTRFDARRNRLFTRGARTSRLVPGPWLIEEDFIYKARGLLWDIPVYADARSSRQPNQFERFAANDINYTSVLARIYANENDPFGNGPVPVPDGLLDTELNFQRSSDAAEASQNDSQNITLMGDFWLGDTQINSVTSYIEYDYDEVLDGDFTAAPLIEVEQQETYEQYFQKIEITSAEDAFIAWRGGLWYMQSNLTFNDETFLQYTERNETNGAILNPALTNNSSPFTNQDVVTELFDPRDPSVNRPDIIRALFGFRQGGSTANFGLDFAHPARTFKQDQELYAAYLQSTINWLDNFRTIIGLRYTYSEKDAVRDLVFRKDDGSIHDLNSADDAENAAYGNALSFGAGVLGAQTHSCLFNPDPGVNLADLNAFTLKWGTLGDECLEGIRREETFLPSIGVEWDVSTDLSLRASARLAGKLGGFDARSNTRPDLIAASGVQPGTFEFKDEVATVYELGATWFLPDGLGQVTGTLFHTDYKNLQLSRSDGKSGSSVDNAGAANNLGIEIEGLLALTERFNINYSLAWIDFEFDEFDFGACHLGRRPDTYFITDRTAERSASARIAYLDPNISFPNSFRGRLGRNYQQLIKGHIPIVYEAFVEGIPNGVTVAPPSPSTGTFRFLDAQQRGVSPYPNKDGADLWLNQSGLPAFCNFRGQKNQFVADWSGTVSFNYENEISGLGIFRPTVDVLYNSGYHTAANQDPLAFQEEFYQFNGRLELASFDDIWVFALTGENLSNEKIVTYSAPTPFGTGLIGARGYIGFTRPPRSIGINFRYNFFQ
ncbi:MAG: TonB-dependent receptor, partial [Gammaproteobacteria bacterium]|nr:TonB-dependent receptor [Gammaproteobacteria bacterium]